MRTLSNKLSVLFLIPICVTVIISCGDHDPKKSNDIYVCGFNTAPNVNNPARGVAYWKNGQEFKISDASGTTIYPWDLAVDGDDVYVGGVEFLGTNGTGTATYWKNGEPVRLTDGTKNNWVFAIAVEAGKVYAVGYGADPSGFVVPKYWNNGVETILPSGFKDSSGIFAWARGIAVVGNDVHIIGLENNLSDTTYARYWKNGQLVPLGAKAKYRYFSDIKAQGTDVYIAGTDNQAGDNILGLMVKYWKNGTEVVLGHGQSGKMVISGNDVYIAADSEAGYFKNHDYTVVQADDTNAGTYAAAISIGLAGSDVVLAALNLKSQDNTRVGSYLFVNGTAQAPFTGDDPKIELVGMVIK
jgi:hypothetical protein